jgi:methylase of polypeptide subunit release factors
MVVLMHWVEDGEDKTARWLSDSGMTAPSRVNVVDDRLKADDAYGLACQGTALLWRGDFQNARQMLLALANRTDRLRRRPKKAGPVIPVPSPAETFHLHRQSRSHRARTLNSLLVPLDADFTIPLPRAPDVRQACTDVYARESGACIAPLQAILGLIGAREWRTKGIAIEAIGGRIHPHYGVFAPIRREYVDLVANASLPASLSAAQEAGGVAFDIGTGTGVLAAVLARRGVNRVVATDIDARALVCARENMARLGLSQVEVLQADLFPDGRAALIVCNPPWVPARPNSSIERGIYDPESRMLHDFLQQLPAHLAPGAEGWLILSDIAEHFGLRTRSALLALFDAAGLKVLDRSDVRPTHPRVADATDPLHAARAAEVTSLWRLAVR